MGISTHKFRVREVRRTTHPVFANINKYWMTVQAIDFPENISTGANARDPVGLNRRVYKEVRNSVDGKDVIPGSFDLMNKGITILADQVRMVDEKKRIYEVDVNDESGGIVDGAHTAKIIELANNAGTTHQDQYVEVYIRTQLQDELIADVASGLNSAIQVAPQSIYNIDGVFDWIKKLIADEPYANKIAWKESDSKPYDVRDIIGILELLNVFDFPNSESKHPISAYEKWSIPLDHFAKDYQEYRDNISASKYYRLRNLLKGGLYLYDRIRRDYREVHNDLGGRAAKLKIVEEATKEDFVFHFSDTENSRFRLHKGAAYPLLGAFRVYVDIDPATGDAKWSPDFDFVKNDFSALFVELVRVTQANNKEVGASPNLMGKNRPHWSMLHMTSRMRRLQAQVSSNSSK